MKPEIKGHWFTGKLKALSYCKNLREGDSNIRK